VGLFCEDLDFKTKRVLEIFPSGLFPFGAHQYSPHLLEEDAIVFRKVMVRPQVHEWVAALRHKSGSGSGATVSCIPRLTCITCIHFRSLHSPAGSPASGSTIIVLRIGETGKFSLKPEQHLAYRTITMLGDYNFRHYRAGHYHDHPENIL
jgi:hypothetical protein